MRGAMDKETEFFLLLIESYARARNRATAEVLREWDEHGITQEISDMYETYHQESLRNAYEDIDHLIATGRHKW